MTGNGDKLLLLDEALARGIEDAEAGRVTPVDEAFRNLRAQLDLPHPNASRLDEAQTSERELE